MPDCHMNDWKRAPGVLTVDSLLSILNTHLIVSVVVISHVERPEAEREPKRGSKKSRSEDRDQRRLDMYST